MPALTGTGVLVTRPLEQSQSLCALLDAAGARTWQLPVLEIRPLVAPPLEGSFDLAVFTSANAVRHAGPVFGALAGTTLAAIGPATARALQAAGYAADVQPAAGIDSEALLAHESFATLAGRRVLLVKGRGGRGLLERELGARGARLRVIDVYERTPVTPDHAALSALERHATSGDVHVVTVTSAEIGTRLMDILSAPLREALDQACWIVPSARVAEALRAHGLRATVRVAAAADDQGLLGAILESRGPSIA